MPREHGSEAVLLAHALFHPDRADVLFRELSVAAFQHPHHRKIAGLMWEHRRKGMPWDGTILSDALEKEIMRDGVTVDEEAKMVFLTFQELASQFMSATPESLREHLRRVREAHEKRQLHQLLTQCAAQVMADDALAEEVFERIEAFKKANARVSAFDTRLRKCLVTNFGLHELDVPARPALMGDFYKEGDLGFIYAPRGAGKTWLAMLLANARAENQPLGEWPAGERAGRVLYVDGEMHLADTKMRSDAIGSPSENFFWLHGDLVFQETERTINLCERDWQVRITELCRAEGITELYLDNLSSLVRGIEENDNDHWRELMLPWMLELRRMKISVVIVAHAGRAEHMRGASGKEDQALWVLKLKPAEEDMREHGAAFVSEFTKSRNSRGTPSPLLWRLQGSESGPMTWTCEKFGSHEVLVRHVQDGVSRNKELAELLGIAPGSVSKLAKKAADLGRIVIRGGSYYPAEGAAPASPQRQPQLQLKDLAA